MITKDIIEELCGSYMERELHISDNLAFTVKECSKFNHQDVIVNLSTMRLWVLNKYGAVIGEYTISIPTLTYIQQ